jgi:predicted neutral ceramidase superfamily lipid hydrolase
MILFLYHHSSNLKNIRERSLVYLCAKEFHQKQNSFIDKIETINLALISSQYLKFVTLLIPGSFVLTNASSKEIEIMLKKLQDLLLISYLKNLAMLKKKSCPLPLDSYKTPYVLSGLVFERNLNHQTVLRKLSWQILIAKPQTQLLMQFEVQAKWKKKIKSKTEEIGLSKVQLL